MVKRSPSFQTLLSFFSLLCLVVISLYLAPSLQRPGIEADFQNYYLANAQYNSSAEQRYGDKISPLVDFRISPDSTTPVKKYIWIGMFSANETISLVSGITYFAYLLQNGLSTDLIIVTSSLLYSALLLGGLIQISHNILRYIFRFDVSPTKSYLTYQFALFDELSIDASGKGGMLGNIKALLGFFPGWLIGLIIGYTVGEYNLYLNNPIISPLHMTAAHLFCACTGSLMIFLLQQAVCFALMRVNIDVTTSHIDDILCAVLGIVISIVVFRNGIGTTISATLGILLYTIVRNSGFRVRTNNRSKEDLQNNYHVSLNGQNDKDEKDIYVPALNRFYILPDPPFQSYTPAEMTQAFRKLVGKKLYIGFHQDKDEPPITVGVMRETTRLVREALEQVGVSWVTSFLDCEAVIWILKGNTDLEFVFVVADPVVDSKYIAGKHSAEGLIPTMISAICEYFELPNSVEFTDKSEFSQSN